MKTKILIIAGLTVTLFTCQTMQAQIRFGVHAAANLETQAELGQLWNNCDIYQGYMLGGFLEYKTGKTLSIQTELNYQKKGLKSNSGTEETNSVTKKEFNYLTIPLLIRGTFHDQGLGERADLTFFSGPYAGFLTSANSRIESAGTTLRVNIDNEAEKSDFGLIFGGGVIYNLKNKGAIVTEFRYQMGLKEIDKIDTNLRNKGFGVSIGYRF